MKIKDVRVTHIGYIYILIQILRQYVISEKIIMTLFMTIK